MIKTIKKITDFIEDRMLDVGSEAKCAGTSEDVIKFHYSYKAYEDILQYIKKLTIIIENSPSPQDESIARIKSLENENKILLKTCEELKESLKSTSSAFSIFLEGMQEVRKLQQDIDKYKEDVSKTS